MKGRRILVVDDDPMINDLLSRIFQKEGAQVFRAANGREALRLLDEVDPDLVLLDILMPGTNGWETLRLIRRKSDVGVIIVTVLDSDKDVLRGLQEGADDHISKPFNHDVLLARARAVLKRTAVARETRVFSDGYLTIDLTGRRIDAGGRPISLTRREFDLLAFLCRNRGRVCTYDQILDAVWGDPYNFTKQNVHLYIWQLRQKIEPNPKEPGYLVAERGVGYRFTPHKKLNNSKILQS